jgi:hypothetical protein
MVNATRKPKAWMIIGIILAWPALIVRLLDPEQHSETILNIFHVGGLILFAAAFLWHMVPSSCKKPL